MLALGILYPFMPGEYDRLAMPLSTLIQGIGLLGMLFSILGLFWLIFQKPHFFANLFLYLALFMILVITFFAYLIAGIIFGAILFTFGLWTFITLRKKHTASTEKTKFSVVPVYLIVIPLFILILQLVIAKPVTDWSRDRTIANAAEYIRDIENFNSKNGFYPKTLQAMYKDYYPQTVGVEQFHYLPYHNSYNISFEQPRFFLDIIGTKEWVVFNPTDAHRVYSHTSWFLLLSPEESAINQGWYASLPTRHTHWKSFLFD